MVGLYKDFKNVHSQLLCLTFSYKKEQREASTECIRQVSRWQLDLKTESFLRNLCGQGNLINVIIIKVITPDLTNLLFSTAINSNYASKPQSK